MNGKASRLNDDSSWLAGCATCRTGSRRRSTAATPVLLGLLLLSIVGCAQQPQVVEVDRPVWIAPPSVCLLPLTWDADADPATNGALWESWLNRGVVIEQASGQLACLRGWAADMAKAIPTQRDSGTGTGVDLSR